MCFVKHSTIYLFQAADSQQISNAYFVIAWHEFVAFQVIGLDELHGFFENFQSLCMIQVFKSNGMFYGPT